MPVRKVRPAYHQIADQIRDLIMGGGLQPGQQLPSEAQLSANFGVSRNTAREALRMLSSQGLIQTTRGTSGGTFVAIPDPIFVQNNIENGLGLMNGGDRLTAAEIYETRLVLEVPAARWAAERRTDEDLERIRIAAASVEGGRETDERTDHSVDFHHAVLEAAGNRLMSLIAPPVWRVFARCAKDSPGKPHLWHDIDCDHAEILEHIQCGDGEAAAMAMKVHLERLRDSES
ncbi:GntR family transcriptional regulator [Devosia pacifica]|uniref:GntR family transcriptional regulator n=1 Tax=Devosia pacifica TaxID=1335967 RepID=A0A918SD57_9HYPH|nr:GntR family transcriptional regulator [Devosia pacifica]